MVTKFIFGIIVIAVVMQRLGELRLSKRQVKRLLSQGGHEHHCNVLGWVKVLQLAWFVAMIAEVLLFDRPFIPVLGAIAFLLLGVGQGLRYVSMRALGYRWTLPLVTLPGQPAVNFGIYHYMRHPNWLGVILEIAALPLIHSAYWTAIGFSILNLVIMVQRVQREEAVLTLENDYLTYLGDRPRFFPSFRSRV